MTLVQKCLAALTVFVELMWLFIRPVWTVTETEIVVFRAVNSVDGISTEHALEAFDQQLSFASAFGGFPRMDEGLFLMQANEPLAGLVLGTALFGALAVVLTPHIRKQIAPTASQE